MAEKALTVLSIAKKEPSIPDGMWSAKNTNCLRYSPGDFESNVLNLVQSEEVSSARHEQVTSRNGLDPAIFEMTPPRKRRRCHLKKR